MAQITADPAVGAKQLSRLQFWRKVQLALVLAGAVLLIAVTQPLYSDETVPRAVMSAIGTVLVATSVFGRLWSALYIGGRKKVELVQDGPYAAVRNPLYVASLFGIVGIGLVFGSMTVALFAGVLSFLIFDRIVQSEEQFLLGSFGAPYERYIAETPRWWPARSRTTLGGRVEVDVAVVMRTMREALTFIVILGFQPLLTMLDESGALPTWFILP
jgi:protein-S-isoprenylcysteine O-methyltransferase Ste14